MASNPIFEAIHSHFPHNFWSLYEYLIYYMSVGTHVYEMVIYCPSPSQIMVAIEFKLVNII